MPPLKERILVLLQDPRVMKLMRNPKIQAMVMKGFRYRGRAEGAFDQGIQRVAAKLNLATQRDLRGLQRRIRHLERELREAEERLNEVQAAR